MNEFIHRDVLLNSMKESTSDFDTSVAIKQGSDTWARKPTLKNPTQNNQILMSYSTVMKKFFY